MNSLFLRLDQLHRRNRISRNRHLLGFEVSVGRNERQGDTKIVKHPDGSTKNKLDDLPDC